MDEDTRADCIRSLFYATHFVSQFELLGLSFTEKLFEFESNSNVSKTFAGTARTGAVMVGFLPFR